MQRREKEVFGSRWRGGGMVSLLCIITGMRERGFSRPGECLSYVSFKKFTDECRGTAERAVELVKRTVQAQSKL